MSFELSVPSKTFLVGEYAVLQGAPALIAATAPYFHFKAQKSTDLHSSLFHADCAASKWFRQSDALLRNWAVKYTDPHESRGGFGASGAQFVFYHAFSTFLQSKKIEDIVEDVWQDYRACDSSRTSGADVVAQTLGGITNFSSRPFEAKSYSWPFDDADFFVIRTGEKMETHAHLEKFRTLNLQDLIAADRNCIEAFFQSNIEAFTSGLAVFQRELTALGLQTEHTLGLLVEISACPGVLVTKGCGAMGADTMLAVVENDFRSEFLEALKDLGLETVASSQDLAPRTRLKVV